MNARDASAKIIRSIEDCRIHVGYLHADTQQFDDNAIVNYLLLDSMQSFYCRAHPYCPVSEQSPDELLFNNLFVDIEPIRCEQVSDNVVVVSRIQRNFLVSAG